MADQLSSPNDIREFSSTVNPPAGAMSSVVFHKEVSKEGPILFIIFINDMPDKITSMIR